MHEMRELTNLQQLELEHAKGDEGTLADLKHSAQLTTDQSKFQARYLARLLGAICSIGLGTLSAYWGFSPPASILTFIAEDIG